MGRGFWVGNERVDVDGDFVATRLLMHRTKQPEKWALRRPSPETAEKGAEIPLRASLSSASFLCCSTSCTAFE